MSDDQIRESAMLGVGPVWRGKSLLPSVNHVAMLERAFHPVLYPDCNLTTKDVLSLLFVTQAPWHQVYAGTHTQVAGDFFAFDEITFDTAVSQWADSIDPHIAFDEIGKIKATAPMIYDQIKASQWKRVKNGITTESTERESGN